MQVDQLHTGSGALMEGPLLITPQVFGDDRGFFFESWNQRRFDAAMGQPITSGAIFDVAVDLRRSSPMFGQWVGAELSGENQPTRTPPLPPSPRRWPPGRCSGEPANPIRFRRRRHSLRIALRFEGCGSTG